MAKLLSDLRRGLDHAGDAISEGHLIRFDWRALLLIAALAFMFIFSVALKLHSSSIGYWDVIYPEGRSGNTGLIAGEPKSVRSDEWLVGTPWMMSQDRQGYPLHNPDIGAHNDPLLNNMPVRHFTSLLKPQDWGFFVLDVERGFSFWWQLKNFGLLVGFFLLLMLLTRNSFWLSLVGALWVLFSGFTQWWFSTMLLEMLASFAFLFIGLSYLFLARKRFLAAAGGAVFFMSALNFVLFFYPPFQVPLVWLAIFLTAGFFVSGDRWPVFRSQFRIRAAALAGIGVAMAAVLFFFYQDAKGTIEAILNTEYPGRRVNDGEPPGLARLFSGFTLAPYGEKDFPAIWGNSSEASNFILLFPVVMMAWARNYLLRIKNDPVVSLLLLYLLAFSAWVVVRWPEALARVTLLGSVTSNRVILGLGIASILVTIVWLSGRDRESDRRFVPGATALAFLLFVMYGLHFNQTIDGGFRYRHVLLMAAFFTLLSWLLLTRRRAAFSALILVALFPYYTVNPLARGLDPLTRNEIALLADDIRLRYPDERWVVYGNEALAGLLKASGMSVINGVNYTPDLDFYSRLDPAGESRGIYNRYAHVTFREPQMNGGRAEDGAPAADAAPQTSMSGAPDGQAIGAGFTLVAGDAYYVDISPCSPLLAELEADHFVFESTPSQQSLSCLEPVGRAEETGVGFYLRRPSH